MKKTASPQSSNPLSVSSIDIAKTMNEALWIGDKDHKTLYVNPTFEKISGYTLKEALGKDCLFFFDKNGKKEINKQHKLRHKGLSSQYQANMLTRNGTLVPLLISGAPTKEGGTIGIFTNLTEIKKLHERQQIIDELIHNSNEAIITLDKELLITSWNNGAQKLFQYREKEVLGKHIRLLIPKDNLEESDYIIKHLENNGHLQNFETVRLDKKKRMHHVNITTSIVRDQEKEFIGYLVRYTDINNQKRASDALQKRFETIQNAYKELGIIQRETEYFQEITMVACSDKYSLYQLGNLIVSAICMLSRCDGAVLRIYNKASNHLEYLSSIGIDRNWQNKNKIPFEKSLAEKSIEKGRTMIFNNIENNHLHKSNKLVRLHGFSTLFLIPLINNGKTVGSLSLYSKEINDLRFIEKDFFEKFSQHISVALTCKMI